MTVIIHVSPWASLDNLELVRLWAFCYRYCGLFVDNTTLSIVSTIALKEVFFFSLIQIMNQTYILPNVSLLNCLGRKTHLDSDRLRDFPVHRAIPGAMST